MRSLKIAGLVAVLSVGAILAVPAMMTAQPAPASKPTSVAVVNIQQVIGDSDEFRTTQEVLRNNRDILERTLRSKQADIEAVKNKLQTKQPGTKEWEDLRAEFVKLTIEFRAWGEITQQELQRRDKMMLRDLYKKAVKATEEVAKQKGIDVVVTTRGTAVPTDAELEGLTVEQLSALIGGQVVTYADKKVDITGDVSALMNAQFKAEGSRPAPVTPPR